MASIKSLYIKIQVVLDIAKAAKPTSFQQLERDVMDSGHECFLTPKYNKRGDVVRATISRNSVLKAMRICLLLALIQESGPLTDTGKAATNRHKFDQILQKQIFETFAAQMVEIETLNKVVQQCMRQIPPILPTARVIWDEARPAMRFSTFSKLLTLLGQCKGAETRQSKVYLEFRPQR